MYSIAEPIRNLIDARDRKIRQMERDFEDFRRIERYKAESLDTIRATYIEICKRVRADFNKEQAKIKEKYAQVTTADEISREVIRAGGLSNRQLLAKTKVIRASELPFKSEIALIYARELRARGGKDNADEADYLAIHVETYLDQPWITDPSYKSLEKLKNTTEVMESQAPGLLVLSLQPTGRGDILAIDGLDIIDKERPGAAQAERMKGAIDAGVKNFGI